MMERAAEIPMGIDARIKEVAAIMAEARTALDQGRLFDLTPLQVSIEGLSAAAKAAPRHETAGLSETVSGLLRELRCLGAQVTAWFDRFEQRSQSADRRCAIGAYTRSEAGTTGEHE